MKMFESFNLLVTSQSAIENNLLRLITRSNRRLCSAFGMPAIEEQRACCNLPCVKNCYFPDAGDVIWRVLR